MIAYTIYEQPGKSNLGSISATFYDQLLHMQIPKAQKDTDDLTEFFKLLGSWGIQSCL